MGICYPSLSTSVCIWNFSIIKKLSSFKPPTPADAHPSTPATTTMIIQYPPPTSHSSSPTFLIVLVNTLDGVAQSPDYNLHGKAAFYWSYMRIIEYSPMFQYRKEKLPAWVILMHFANTE